jgi:hypothetical protein
VLLVTATGLAVAVADGALRRADRDPVARHAAAATAERLVAPPSQTTRRANVLRGSRVRNLTPRDVGRLSPPVRGRPVAVSLDGRTVVARGDPAGPAVRRGVWVATTERVVRRADAGEAVVVPGGVARADVTVRAGPNATVRTLRADGRPVLRDPAGLAGRATVRLSPLGPTTLRTTAGANATLRVAYDRARTRPATLEVRVGVR